MCCTVKNIVIKPTAQNLFDSVVEIAANDIAVFKCVNKQNGKLVTPFQRTVIPDNGVLTAKKFTYRINWRTFKQGNELKISHGIHAYITNPNSNGAIGGTMRKAIIPAGTKYVMGSDNTVVALKLIITGMNKKWIKANGSKRTNTKPSKRRVAKK